MGALGALARGVLEVFLPAACPLCGAGGGDADPDGGLCPRCVARVHPVADPRCPLCLLSFDGAGPSHPCGSCLRRPPPFRGMAVAGRYEGALKECVHGLKYGGRLWMRRPLGDLLAGACRGAWPDPPPFAAVVPVPCHPRTLARRGFDLPALLARRAAREYGAPFRPRALKKVRAEARMTGLGLKERRVVVRGLYRGRETLRGPVLLVDDVVTTTHTIRAAARACLAAGGAEVWVAALARTPVGPFRD